MSPSNPGRPKPDKATRVFVDSGAWLAFFSAADQKHSEADALFRQAAAQRVRLVTTNLVLVEVHRLLLFRVGPKAASTALARIDESALVTIVFGTRTHHRAARGWLSKLADQKISYADATSFAVMDAERCRVAISFDHDFWSAGFEIWQA